MAGKRGRRRNELVNINPALVPSAAFTVVPRTPAPEPVPTSGLGGSREVLSASLLGRPSVPDDDQDDEPFSDPESSLYDYQVMEEAGYSSVDMLSVSRKRRTGTMSDRDPASIPGTSQRREHDIDEHQQARMAQAIDSPEMHNNPEALYATPIKRGHQERTGATAQTMRSTLAVRDAMQQVHDLSSDEETRPVGRHRRRPQKRVHQTVEKAVSARSLHFPVEHETIRKERSSRRSQSSPTTPLHTPKYKPNQEPHIHEQIYEPVREHMQQLSAPDEPVSARTLSQSARSGAQSTRSGMQSARSVSMADDRIHTLEAEKEHLTTLTLQLENEVHSYREVVSTYESGESETAQSLLTKKQISDLREENESLKNSIKRLNIELSSYQAKYRPVHPDQTGDVMGLPSKGPVPSWLPEMPDPLGNHPIINELNIRYLNPLFLAYDDRLREREDTIKKCQSDMESLRHRTEEVVRENEKLHSRLEHGGAGPVDSTEWEQMKENARLVLEENQNLLEQINVRDQKAHDLHQAHVREVSKLSKQMVLLKGEKSDMDSEADQLRQAHRDLKQKHDKLVLETQGQITQEQHIHEIADLKQKLAEQEELHKQEVDTVSNKMHASQLERKTMGGQLIEVSAENRRYQTELKVMHKSVRKAQQKMLLLHRAIEQSENKEMSVQEYMSSIIKVAEKNAFERDTYEKVAKENELETKKAMKRLLHGNITVGKMEEKLKLYKMKAAARIGTVAERLKEQEELFNSQKKEYEREINHLRMLVKEKEELLQKSVIDKRDVEESLEAMYQAANSENVRIRDEMHQSVQKLRKHPGLSEAIDAHDKLETSYLSSDDEGRKVNT